MGKMRRHCGFSLIEVLLAVGTLAVGMIFIGGTFLVGVHLAGVSAERSTATIVANEAFAKIELFRVDPWDGSCATDRQTPFETLRNWPVPGSAIGPGPTNPSELAYPSERTMYPLANTVVDRQYFWSALCRRDPNNPNTNLFVTVFVSRKVGAAAMYEGPAGPVNRPIAMPVDVQGVAGSNILILVDNPATPFDETRWIGPGYAIVEDSKGHRYRVVRHGNNPTVAEIVLDKPWNPDGIYPDPDVVWVVPPPIGRGKGPCIEVYQTEITF